MPRLWKSIDSGSWNLYKRVVGFMLKYRRLGPQWLAVTRPKACLYEAKTRETGCYWNDWTKSQARIIVCYSFCHILLVNRLSFCRLLVPYRRSFLEPMATVHTSRTQGRLICEKKALLTSTSRLARLGQYILCIPTSNQGYRATCTSS